MKSNATPAATPKPPKQHVRGTPPPRPEKPWPDFPLNWHTRGYWRCKRNGKEYRYKADAIESYDLYKEDLKAWERATVAPSEIKKGHTVRDALNLFLTGQSDRLADGKIGSTQFAKYRAECEAFAAVVDPTTRLRRLCGEDGPTIFRKAEQAALARGLVVAERHFYMIRSALDLANRRGLMPPANFGGTFEKPTPEQHARVKLAEEAEHGERAWSNDELRAIVAGAYPDPHLFAMVLLALNCGFGNDDCAILRDRMIDRERNLIRTHRSKTLRKRVCPLWDITLWAIDRSRAGRAAPADPADGDRVFLTANGLPVTRPLIKSDAVGPVSTGRNDAVRQAFDELLERLQDDVDGTSLRQQVRRLIGDGFFDVERSIDAVQAELKRRKVTYSPRGPGRECRLLEASGLLVRAGTKYRTETFRAAEGAQGRLAAAFVRDDAARARGRGLKLTRHKQGFYGLRSSFRGLAVGAGVESDLIAVIMGQKFARPIDEYYLRSDLRLKLVQVVEHVFRGLFDHDGWASPWPR